MQLPLNWQGACQVMVPVQRGVFYSKDYQRFPIIVVNAHSVQIWPAQRSITRLHSICHLSNILAIGLSISFAQGHLYDLSEALIPVSMLYASRAPDLYTVFGALHFV